MSSMSLRPVLSAPRVDSRLRGLVQALSGMRLLVVWRRLLVGHALLRLWGAD